MQAHLLKKMAHLHTLITFITKLFKYERQACHF